MFRRLSAVRKLCGSIHAQPRLLHYHSQSGQGELDSWTRESERCRRFRTTSGQLIAQCLVRERSEPASAAALAVAPCHNVEVSACTKAVENGVSSVNGVELRSLGVSGNSKASAFWVPSTVEVVGGRNGVTKNCAHAEGKLDNHAKILDFRGRCRILGQVRSPVGFKHQPGGRSHYACRALSTTCAPREWSSGPPTSPTALTELALDSVVKVYTMSSSPNYFLPWQNKPQREITGSGFVISGRRIVTNAHVVADQTYVVVRKHGSPSKYRAEVQAVGHECDLALLRIEDEEFWHGMRTLQLGDIPYLQESVYVVGYPQGGDNISVTGGVVSRVEPTQYVHGTAHLMAIQIDAAINPGNSGGPALMEDRVVGVAFQNLAGAENIGYIIPVPIIEHFLEDVQERGQYVGFGSLGVTCQATENSQLREHLKMPPGLTGVLINKIQPLTHSHQSLKKDDVLLAFDDHPIGNDGTVHFRNRERIAFDHLVSMKKAGEKAAVRLWRDRHVENFDIIVNPLRNLVPVHQFDRLPSYFIFAGLVFTPLTQPYLHEYGDDWYNIAPRRLCEKALTGMPSEPDEQVVVLSQILMDEVNAGYERLSELQVREVNGTKVINLKHLKELVENCTVPSLRFDLDDSRVVVLNFDKAKEASPKILVRHRIPSHASVDLHESSPLGKEEKEESLSEKAHSNSQTVHLEKTELPIGAG